MLFTFTTASAEENAMSNTADTRWRGMTIDQETRPWRSGWHPASIAVMVLGFMVWWPIGLAVLFYNIGSRNMGGWGNARFASKMQKCQDKMDRIRGRMERGGFQGFGSGFGFGPPSSGNRAFDEYRAETLRRLEDEQEEFKSFLDRLRHAKDKEEFDAFMAQQRGKGSTPSDPAQG
jgi:hypothetical protein